ncbi:MAG: translation initiation factor IF-2 N-terminal domain-containing protein, partial [Nannocystaceae bacterium]
MATKKIRVYELARELGKETKVMQKLIKGLGFEIKNYMSTLTVEEANKVRGHVGGSPMPQAAAAESKPSSRPSRRRTTVIRRTAKGPRPAVVEAEARAKKAAEEAARAAEVEMQTRSVARPTIRRRPAVVADSAENTEKKASVVPETPPVHMQEAQSEARGESKKQSKAEVTRENFRKRNQMPTVDQRISLPAGTRRLPGGLAGRMADKPPRPQRHAGSRPATAAKVEKPAEKPAAKPEVAAKPAAKAGPPRRPDDNRRVVRNDAGVIVGVAKQRAEPRIKGFIQLSQMRPRQQVIITDAGDEPRGGRASQRKQREERIQQQGRRRKMPLRNRKGQGNHTPRVVTQEMSEAKKRIRVDEAIQVADLAHQMGKKAGAIMRVLWGMGLRGLTINHAVDIE